MYDLENVSYDNLSEQLETAKRKGCIGVIVELVLNQNDGAVIAPQDLAILSRVCVEKRLIFAIDETITSIRCGAPFAYHRPEYISNIKPPDLVFFGKGLSANGTAINFDGSIIRQFGITTAERKRQALRNWQGMFTRPIQLPVLIQALGVLEMAVAGDWIERSRVIGRHIREIIQIRTQGYSTIEYSRDIFGGLDSFIFVRRDIAARFLVMGASLAGPWIPWVRWLPRLDAQLTDRSVLEELMGSASGPARVEMSKTLANKGLKPPWCFVCGNKANNVRYSWCQRCCIDVCDTDACAQGLSGHECFND